MRLPEDRSDNCPVQHTDWWRHRPNGTALSTPSTTGLNFPKQQRDPCVWGFFDQENYPIGWICSRVDGFIFSVNLSDTRWLDVRPKIQEKFRWGGPGGGEQSAEDSKSKRNTKKFIHPITPEDLSSYLGGRSAC